MSAFNLLTSLGWLISLGLSSFACTYVKLALILVSLVISTACVVVAILHEKWYAKLYGLVSDFDLARRDIAVLTTIKK